MKKIATIALSSLLMSSLTFGTAFAFSDVDEGQREAVSALQTRGIVSGIDNEHFAPKTTISYAQSVQMIVKALNLNLDAIRFKAEPKASGTYTNIADDAWYANAFVIAYYNGLEIPKDVNPNAAITREQFGDLLVRALEKKGSFPLVKMYIQIKDEDQITVGYQGALQRLLLYKITQLDSNGNFNPKGGLTRGEAASWTYNAVRMLEAHTQKPPVVSEEVTFKVEKVNDELNKVTLTRGEKPTGGYAIKVDSIRFQDSQAVIAYTLIDPQPDQMNTTVITKPEAVTYISSAYTPVIEPTAASNVLPIVPIQ